MGEIRPGNMKHRFVNNYVPRRSIAPKLAGNKRIETLIKAFTGIKTDLGQKSQDRSLSAKLNPHSVKNILSADTKISISHDHQVRIIKAFSAFRAARSSHQNKPSLDTQVEYSKTKAEIVQLLLFLGGELPGFLRVSDEKAAKDIEKTLNLVKKLP
jgi:hypothetical protein